MLKQISLIVLGALLFIAGLLRVIGVVGNYGLKACIAAAVLGAAAIIIGLIKDKR
jgi:hypothetical protein